MTKRTKIQRKDPPILTARQTDFMYRVAEAFQYMYARGLEEAYRQAADAAVQVAQNSLGEAARRRLNMVAEWIADRRNEATKNIDRLTGIIEYAHGEDGSNVMVRQYALSHLASQGVGLAMEELAAMMAKYKTKRRATEVE